MSLSLTKSKVSILSDFVRTRAFHASSWISSAIDFSKSVEEFKKNGIAILPVKVEEEFVVESKKKCML